MALAAHLLFACTILVEYCHPGALWIYRVGSLGTSSHQKEQTLNVINVLKPNTSETALLQKEKAEIPRDPTTELIIPPAPQLLRPPNRNFRAIHAIIDRDPNYNYLASGAYRRVFKIMNEKFVLKIPHTYHGERDNIVEALLYVHDPYRRAWCELVDFHGIWALKMECVDEVRTGVFPDWVYFLTGDGPQCGYRQNPLQTLVVYDYACIWNKTHLKKQFQWLLDHYGTY